MRDLSGSLAGGSAGAGGTCVNFAAGDRMTVQQLRDLAAKAPASAQ